MDEKTKPCAVCGSVTGPIVCAGCGKALCEVCAHFELLGSGCGTVYPLYYCPTCSRDEHINPNAGLHGKPW